MRSQYVQQQQCHLQYNVDSLVEAWTGLLILPLSLYSVWECRVCLEGYGYTIRNIRTLR